MHAIEVLAYGLGGIAAVYVLCVPAAMLVWAVLRNVPPIDQTGRGDRPPPGGKEKGGCNNGTGQD